MRNRLSNSDDCSEQEWITNNRKAFDWYYSAYPALREYVLPLDFDFLKRFYIEDMNDNHNATNPEWTNCYSLVFSYFLGRISGQNTFVGRTWYKLLIDAFPIAIKKTFNDVTKPFGIPLWMYGLGIITVIIALKK